MTLVKKRIDKSAAIVSGQIDAESQVMLFGCTGYFTVLRRSFYNLGFCNCGYMHRCMKASGLYFNLYRSAIKAKTLWLDGLELLCGVWLIGVLGIVCILMSKMSDIRMLPYNSLEGKVLRNPYAEECWYKAVFRSRNQGLATADLRSSTSILSTIRWI